uniref:Cytochrome P450 n=1 Tax=Kalanchoe fedtschenkoi TaxID=63787 RepID=A0A7N1A0G8_KALFE
METKAVDTLWLFALAAKCQAFTTGHNLFFSAAILLLTWLATLFLFWAYPGGPAWGTYWFRKGFSFRNRASTIPGPRGLPLFGSMSIMTNLAHHKIAAAASELGANRLMAYSLGQTRVIVTCNSDVAKEILNSSVFADRPIKESAYSLLFNRAIGFAPYGVYWRTLRRISATHMFCPKQIKASEPQRRIIVEQMCSMFDQKSDRAVRVRDVLKAASLNNMMCSVFGRSYELNSSNEEVGALKEMVDEGYDLLGRLNWSDHLPWLAEFDLQKIRSRCFELVPKVNQFVERIIAEHRGRTSDAPPDFVDVLLSLEGEDKLSDSDMVAVLWEMIFRGTDTVAVLIEWVVARMVVHPEIQSKVHQELDRVVGRSRRVKESDVASLRYLSGVIKEVLRMHPPGPLLSWARLSITDTTVDGHHVPAGTTAMVNMWAICRDPQVWSDPLSFKPERFLGDEEFSIMGSDLRLAPFGSGRRSCPGKSLGLATVSYWVASMMHEFEWLPVKDGAAVDLTERLKLSSEMKEALKARIRGRRNP